MPELSTIDSQIMFAPSATRKPANIVSLDKALLDSEARLATVDKTNLDQYVNIMQQVLMLRHRKAFSSTREELLAQKVQILEGLINQSTVASPEQSS